MIIYCPVGESQRSGQAAMTTTWDQPHGPLLTTPDQPWRLEDPECKYNGQGVYCSLSIASEVLFLLPNYIHVYAIMLQYVHILRRGEYCNRIPSLPSPIRKDFQIHQLRSQGATLRHHFDVRLLDNNTTMALFITAWMKYY